MNDGKTEQVNKSRAFTTQRPGERKLRQGTPHKTGPRTVGAKTPTKPAAPPVPGAKPAGN